MIELDFSTPEGCKKAQEAISNVVNSGDKEELSHLLYFLMGTIASHEKTLEDLKSIFNFAGRL